jgi:hypothetical protein
VGITAPAALFVALGWPRDDDPNRPGQAASPMKNVSTTPSGLAAGDRIVQPFLTEAVHRQVMVDAARPVSGVTTRACRHERSPGWRAGRLRRTVRCAPFTCGYLAVLLMTTLVLRHVSSRVGNRLLAASSTDVAHLARDPVRVLLASALWLPGRTWLPYAVVFLLVLAPLERRFGVRRTVAVFLSGHLLATLLTELPIAAAIAVHWAAPSAAHRLDVGVSYGTYAAVGAFAGSLQLRWRPLVLAGAVLSIVAPAMPAPDMTMWGHLLALVIGVCWWWSLYGARRGRRSPGGLPRPDRSATCREGATRERTTMGVVRPVCQPSHGGRP